jgi:hypothetical protein
VATRRYYSDQRAGDKHPFPTVVSYKSAGEVGVLPEVRGVAARIPIPMLRNEE